MSINMAALRSFLLFPVYINCFSCLCCVLSSCYTCPISYSLFSMPVLCPDPVSFFFVPCPCVHVLHCYLFTINCLSQAQKFMNNFRVSEVFGKTWSRFRHPQRVSVRILNINHNWNTDHHSLWGSLVNSVIHLFIYLFKCNFMRNKWIHK